MFNLHMDLETLLTTSTSALVAIGGLWISISKNNREAKKDRIEHTQFIQDIIEKITDLTDSVKEIKAQNEAQQQDIIKTKSVTDSFFRMELYNALTKALKRGYTTVSEATEITKLFIAYTENGGNGEIKILYGHFDKLPIKEDNFETN